MSAAGHERAILRCLRHVRLRSNTHRDSGHPKSAALCQKRTHAAPQNPRLFDHLVGPDHQRQRHVDAELNERRHPGYFPA